VTAITFTLTSPSNGEVLGFALICPEGGYCSLKFKDGDRLDRRLLSLDRWKAVEGEIARGLPVQPLETDSAIVTALAPNGRWVVTYLRQLQIDAAPDAVAAVLDKIISTS
jgi:hypothetical protein